MYHVDEWKNRNVLKSPLIGSYQCSSLSVLWLWVERCLDVSGLICWTPRDTGGMMYWFRGHGVQFCGTSKWIFWGLMGQPHLSECIYNALWCDYKICSSQEYSIHFQFVNPPLQCGISFLLEMETWWQLKWPEEVCDLHRLVTGAVFHHIFFSL